MAARLPGLRPGSDRRGAVQRRNHQHAQEDRAAGVGRFERAGLGTRSHRLTESSSAH